MRNVAIVVSAILTTLLPAAAADAQPLSGQALQGRASGSEFRGSAQTQRGAENHIWRFRPDGTATGVGIVQRSVGYGTYQYEIGDAGRWRIESDRLCVEWSGVNSILSGCYTFIAQAGNHVRLAGPIPWEGTLGQ